MLEPLQMWVDLLVSGVGPKAVTLLCLGGGTLSAMELALAWAVEARSAVLADGSVAAQRFGSLLEWAGELAGRGILVPEDPATLAAMFAFDQGIDAATWESAGQAVHAAYLNMAHKNATQPNLLAWPHLSEDFKHSNRHQAACAVAILRGVGFEVEPAGTNAPAADPVTFTPEEVETMAASEHGRWNLERLNAGWRYGLRKDEARRISPYLVPWKQLPLGIQAYDRQAVEAWPRILAGAGWVVRRPRAAG